jgi:hypothetical protein
MVDWMFLFRRACVLLLISSVLFCDAAHGADLFKLSDLSSKQRSVLFEQVDGYGMLAAVLNYCKRPPKMVDRLTPIAHDCVDDVSFQVVVRRYNEAIAKNAGAYHCEDKAFQKEVARFEANIDSVVSGFKTACRVRSFLDISFPKAG